MAIKTTGGLKTSWLSDAMYRMTGVGTKMPSAQGESTPYAEGEEPTWEEQFGDRDRYKQSPYTEEESWQRHGGYWDAGGKWRGDDPRGWYDKDGNWVYNAQLRPGQAICGTSILIGGVLSCLSALYFISCL